MTMRDWRRRKAAGEMVVGMNSFSDSYKAAGVDVTAGYKAVELMKSHVARTKIPGVLSGIGGFGGLFEPDLSGVKNPVLVSGTDGVGTKLKIAFLLDKHDTVGIDCVAMCVNDVVCCGAKPLFFLDYIAVGRNVPERVAAIVSGVAEGCVQAGASLTGGETAEMPGFYAEDEYDLAGFAVGVVDKDKILDNSRVKEGDVTVSYTHLILKIFYDQHFFLVPNPVKPAVSVIKEGIDSDHDQIDKIQYEDIIDVMGDKFTADSADITK